MFNPDRIEDLQNIPENQILDRKSAKIQARDLAEHVVGMANADGGYLVIGIDDDGKITGIDGMDEHVNDLVRVPFDYCIPSAQVETDRLDVTDYKGNPNHILRMHISPSSEPIKNQADEVFLRVGDKTKKLNFEQRLQLLYAKGTKYYEDQPVTDATIEDIDLDYVAQYCGMIGYTRGPEEYLHKNKDFITTVDGQDRVSGAAILLFGKNPQKFFPRARTRFVRFEGNTAEVGERMNVIKDVEFEGRILEQAEKCIEFVKTQIREYTKLGAGAVFTTTPEYPEFCWTELIVNAIAHRDYSIKGTDIQVKMFDDHFTVESPGILSGLVRIDNIREYHFSRNPKIVELLKNYKLVQEFGEGIDRVFRDMESAALPAPEFRVSGNFMFYATLKNKNWGKKNASWVVTEDVAGHDAGHDGAHDRAHDGAHDRTHDDFKKLVEFCSLPRSRQEMMDYIHYSSRRHFADRYLKPLLESGRIKMTMPDKPQSKNQKYVKV